MPSLLQIIQEEIHSQGPMPFRRFMELALYCPDLGYYEQKSRIIGQGGDFYTSPSTGQLFGELLAFRFARWLENITDRPLCLVEAGAHDGTLARDILTWLHREKPKLAERLVYGILEPSPRRQQWQEARLSSWKNQVRWWSGWQEFDMSEWSGVVFSNELLDALPVRRLGWARKSESWYEWAVDGDGDRFRWVSLDMPVPEARTLCLEAGLEIPRELQDLLPDGFTLDLCPDAAEWWRTAARRLDQGFLMTLDYGFPANQFLVPERTKGTLRAYRRHQLTQNLLDDPGDQDLTAHVNFTQLQTAGESEGLNTVAMESQAKFLTGILQEIMGARDPEEPWDSKTVRQFQTLTHPQHMGESFHVLVQQRGLQSPSS